MDEAIRNWIKSSDYDVRTATALLKSRRYVYVIFMFHLTVEKALKALVVQKRKRTPPRIHDLFRLANLAGIVVPERHQSIISHLNEASVPTRYPEDFSKLVRHYNKAAAERYLAETKGFLKWLKAQIK